MSNLGKAIRQVRFNLKDTEKIHLIVETMTGERINLKMINCSLTGIGTLAEFTNDKPTGFEIDSIIPASKIICNEQEISLGRLIIRRIEPQGNKTYIAFSTMDIKVPVDGILTHYTVGELDVQKNPFAYELSPDKFNMASFEMDSVSNADLFYRTDQFDIYYKEFEKSLKFQYSNTRLASQGERIKLDKKRKNNRNDYLVMGSNDYLGLASDPTVCEAARKAVLDYGFGSTGSPVTTGSTDIHDELSSYLSKLFKKESVLLFNSGYAANLGTIAGLTRVEDLIIADHNSHASIHDGISLSKATSRYFKHNDVGHLEKLLQEHRASHFGSLIITEGVFSMDGDIPPLEDIIKIARQYNSRIFLDEAHSFGVIGPTGLGCWELCADKEDKIDIIMGTFSKICGGIGGFIAGPKSVTHWLKC